MDTERVTPGGSRPEPGTNVLVLSPAPVGEGHACEEFLAPTTPSEQNVLFVTYTESVEECVRRWWTVSEEPPAKWGIVTAGDFARSAATRSSFTPLAPGNGPVVSVVDPEDPVDIGIRISEYFEECGLSLNDSGDLQTVVCFDSLTALLQYDDLEHAYKFLHVLVGLLKSIDAVAHFHLDPEACDPQTVAILRSLFDRVVEVPGE